MSAARTRARASRKLARAQARVLNEQAYRLRRANDGRDINRLP